MCKLREQLLTESSAGEHLAHLYVDSHSLCEALGVYALAALDRGHALITIAVPSHQEGLFSKLRSAGRDPQALIDAGQLVCIDAVEFLDIIVPADQLRTDIFLAAVKPTLVAALEKFGGVTAYGELVNLLWQRKQRPLALELEQVWNTLIDEFGIALLCGYKANVFDDTIQDGLEEICQTHTHFIPLMDFDRLELIVDIALGEVLNTADVESMRQTLAQRCNRRAQMPEAQAAVFALDDLLPSMAQHVRMLARAGYKGGRM
jgi:hypothetical protein